MTPAIQQSRDTECRADTEHTPTPWMADDTAIFAADGVLARIPNHPENGKNWKNDAAFIVEAVNSHAALQARVAELERILRECRRFIDPDCDPSALTNRALTLQINRALSMPLEQEKSHD